MIPLMMGCCSQFVETEVEKTLFTVNSDGSHSLSVSILQSGGSGIGEIDWGDGSPTTSGSGSHTYSTPGTYSGSIRFFAPSGASGIRVGGSALVSVEHIQQGLESISFREVGSPSPRLVSVPSFLPTSITSIASAFRGATLFNDASVVSWDVSNVVNMTGLFWDAASFNRDLSGWCVSNIPESPSSFDTGASSWVLPRPVWGTCPGG